MATALLRQVFEAAASSVEVDPPRVDSMAYLLFVGVNSSANAAGNQFRLATEGEARKAEESEREPKAAVWRLARRKEIADDEMRMTCLLITIKDLCQDLTVIRAAVC